jgi:hypothetical protein
VEFARPSNSGFDGLFVQCGWGVPLTKIKTTSPKAGCPGHPSGPLNFEKASRFMLKRYSALAVSQEHV